MTLPPSCAHLTNVKYARYYHESFPRSIKSALDPDTLRELRALRNALAG